MLFVSRMSIVSIGKISNIKDKIKSLRYQGASSLIHSPYQSLTTLNTSKKELTLDGALLLNLYCHLINIINTMLQKRLMGVPKFLFISNLMYE